MPYMIPWMVSSLLDWLERAFLSLRTEKKRWTANAEVITEDCQWDLLVYGNHFRLTIIDLRGREHFKTLDPTKVRIWTK